jgi:hypothetical protein
MDRLSNVMDDINATESQSTRLERVEALLSEQMAHNEALQAEIQRLFTLLAPTPTVTPHPPPKASTPAPPAVKTRVAKIAPPENFNGDRYKLPMFLSRCTHHFLNDPEKFTTERSKVMFAGSYLQGIAYSWFESLLRQVEANPNDPPAELDSFSEFKQSLQTNFGDPNVRAVAQREEKRGGRGTMYEVK